MSDMQCFNCNVRLKRLRRHSLSTESKALVSVIRIWTYPRDITPKDCICHACWELASHEPTSDNIPRQFGHLHICVVCGRSVQRTVRRTVMVEGANEEEKRMANIILQWIQPRELTSEHEACVLCWQRARRAVRQQTTVHNNQAETMCGICGNSITTTRPTSAIEGQIPRHILEIMEINQVTSADHVCHNCWILPNRDLPSTSCTVSDDDIQSPVGHRHVCVNCGRSLLRKRFHQLRTNTEREKHIYVVISNWISPQQVGESSSICHPCWQRANRARAPAVQTPAGVLNGNCKSVTKKCVTIDPETIELPQYKKISQSADHCIFPECSNQNLQTISNNLQVRTLKDYDIFIPQNSMICDTHLNSNNWNKLYKDKANVSTFTAEDIEQIFSLVQTKANTDANFKNYMTIDEHTFIYFLGVNRETVNVILKYLPQIEEIDHGALGLIGLFIKHENGGPNDRIANLLKLPLESLQNAMKHVKEILVNNPIVTKNMGIEYLLKRHL